MKTFLTLFKIVFLGLLIILLWPFLAYLALESTWLVVLIILIFGPLIIFKKDIEIHILKKKVDEDKKPKKKK
jgi:hypothetical protein